MPLMPEVWAKLARPQYPSLDVGPASGQDPVTSSVLDGWRPRLSRGDVVVTF